MERRNIREAGGRAVGGGEGGSIQRKNFFTGRLIHSKCGHLFCGFYQRRVMVLCVGTLKRGMEREGGVGKGLTARS